MKLLFVADPLESFKIYKDTTFAMMREAHKRGHQVSACEVTDIAWRSGGLVTAAVRDITLTTAGTTGAQTIDKPVGSVNLAAAATSLVVTSSLVGTAANTIVLLTVGSNDATTKSCAVVVGTGQFTIYPDAAPTAETVVFFQIIRVL